MPPAPNLLLRVSEAFLIACFHLFPQVSVSLEKSTHNWRNQSAQSLFRQHCAGLFADLFRQGCADLFRQLCAALFRQLCAVLFRQLSVDLHRRLGADLLRHLCADWFRQLCTALISPVPECLQ